MRPRPGLLHLHAPSQLERGRAAFKDQDQNRAHCPIPRNHFLTGSVQVYSCLPWEDKPELEGGPIEAWLSNAGSARAQGWRKPRLKALPPFIPSPPNPGQRWWAVPRSCHRRRHFPPVHPEFPSGSILCVPSAQRMPDGQQARSKCISAQRAATDPISWGDSGQNSESPLCAVSAASCLNFPRGPV